MNARDNRITVEVSPFTGAMNPQVYLDFTELLIEGVQAARRLGLHRTGEALQQALTCCRAEIPEAMPPNPLTIEFKIGPVRDRRSTPSLLPEET